MTPWPSFSKYPQVELSFLLLRPLSTSPSTSQVALRSLFDSSSFSLKYALLYKRDKTYNSQKTVTLSTTGKQVIPDGQQDVTLKKFQSSSGTLQILIHEARDLKIVESQQDPYVQVQLVTSETLAQKKKGRKNFNKRKTIK